LAEEAAAPSLLLPPAPINGTLGPKMAESSAPELVVYYPIYILRSDGANYGDLVDDRFAALDPADPSDMDKVESWEITLAHHLNAQLNLNKNDSKPISHTHSH